MTSRLLKEQSHEIFAHVFLLENLNNWCFFTRSLCSVFTIGLGFSLNLTDKFPFTVSYLFQML